MLKVCIRCKEGKYRSQFHKLTRQGKWIPKDGLNPKCKVCVKKLVYAWREKNWDKFVASLKKYNKKHREENNTRVRAWRKKYPNRAKKSWARYNRTHKYQISIRKKKAYLFYVYKISPENYDSMARRQDYLCAICREQKILFVDHDHRTKKVRGLLCRDCNFALGHAKDSLGIIKGMFKYIKKYRNL